MPKSSFIQFALNSSYDKTFRYFQMSSNSPKDFFNGSVQSPPWPPHAAWAMSHLHVIFCTVKWSSSKKQNRSRSIDSTGFCCKWTCHQKDQNKWLITTVWNLCSTSTLNRNQRFLPPGVFQTHLEIQGLNHKP